MRIHDEFMYKKGYVRGRADTEEKHVEAIARYKAVPVKGAYWLDDHTAMAYCPRCGKTLQNNQNYCYKCGQRLKWNDLDSEETQDN